MVAQGVVVRGVRAPSAQLPRSTSRGAEWWASGASSDHQLIDRNVDVVEALTTVDDAKGDVAFTDRRPVLDDLGASQVDQRMPKTAHHAAPRFRRDRDDRPDRFGSATGGVPT